MCETKHKSSKCLSAQRRREGWSGRLGGSERRKEGGLEERGLGLAK